MTKEKVIPQIRFSGFTDTWEQRKFREQYQKITEKNDLSFGADKIISVANMYFKSDVKQSDDDYMRSYNIMRLGDIAFEGNKSKHFAHGRFVENTIGDGIVSHVFDVFRPIADYDLLFWKYLINYEGVMGRIMTRCTKASTMMTNLVADDFLAESILVPSIQEQEKIGAFLDKLDSFITLHQRKYDKLTKVKKAMLEKMFPENGSPYPEIRFKGFTDAWQQRKLGEISESFEYGLNAAATEYDGKHKYIRITDIDDSTHLFLQDDLTSPDIDFSTADDYLLQEGDVLFARTGASVGKTYIYRRSDGDLYFAGFLIRAKIKSDYDADFVFQNTLTDRYDSYIRITSQRSGQPGVNAQEYANFALSVPSLAEQKKIGAYFSHLDSLITLHQRKLEKLKNIKKACLEKMFV